MDFMFDYVDRFISVCRSEHGDAVPMGMQCPWSQKSSLGAEFRQIKGSDFP